MNKFVIMHLRLRLAQHGRTAGSFVYDDALGAHIYGGKRMGQKEFNAFMRSRDWQRLIELEGATNVVPQVLINDMRKAQEGLAVKRAQKRQAKTQLALIPA